MPINQNIIIISETEPSSIIKVGIIGPQGPPGTSGTAGTSGTSGITISGSSGTSGTAGTSGTSGISGSSGTSGTAGTSGTTPSGATGNIIYQISGLGTPTTSGYIPVDINCVVKSWTLSADVAGSVTVAIWKANASIPTSAGNMCSTNGTVGISLVGSQYGTGGVSGWNCTSITAGDVLGFVTGTSGTCAILTIGLKVTAS